MNIKRLAVALLLLLLVTPAYAADEIPFPDISCETTTTTGTGTVNLAGALSGGYLGFATQVTSGNSVFYNIVTGTGVTRKVEVGKGVFTDAAPDTLTRVAAWSTDGAATNISLTGTSTVCIDVSGSYFDQGAGSGLNADKLDSVSSTGFAQITGTPADNQVAVWTGATNVEGDSAFTFDTATDALSVGTSGIFTTGTIELGAASDTTIARSAAGEATLEGDAIKHAGKETIWIPSPSMVPNVTSGPATGTYDSGTNDLTIYVLDFDTGATEERADFQIGMPKGWNEGTFTFVPISVCTGCSAAQTIQFELACVAISHDDTLNATMGTAQSSSVTVTATNDSQVGAESSAITCAGTPAENDLVAFRISRDTSVDNAAGDARLIGIKLFWTSNAASDD